ncbi:MAG: VWA domain-containing protein [Pseudomonas sp.]
MLDFAWPAAALLLPLPWILGWLLPPAANRTAALQVGFIERLQHIEASQHAHGSNRLRWPLVLIWLLLVTAAARPQWLGDPLPISVSGRDMMLAVDLSGSMEYRDMQLNGEEVDRFTLVRHQLGEFIRSRHGDRLGLILFGSSAYVQAPLTHDLNSVSEWLEEAFIGLPGRQTAIGDAIGLAIKRLAQENAESRVLVLLTDGANNAGQLNPHQAARLAAAERIRIFTVGVGGESLQQSLIPGLFSREIDPSVELDEATLSDIALLTGGEYFRARDGDSLAEIYRRIGQLEPALRDGRPQRHAQPLYIWPLALAMLLSLLAACLAVMPRRRRHVA